MEVEDRITVLSEDVNVLRKSAKERYILALFTAAVVQNVPKKAFAKKPLLNGKTKSTRTNARTSKRQGLHFFRKVVYKGKSAWI